MSDCSCEIFFSKIKSLYYEQNGFLWVGIYGFGLSVFDLKNKTFYIYDSNDGLPNHIIYAILSGAKNHL